jgi:hypothetical protein
MRKCLQILPLSILLLGSMNFSDVAQAQFIPDPFFWQKPHQIAPQKYRKLNNGTILETSTGNIYDRRGNLLQRGSGPVTIQKKRCRYITTNNCGLYNINCTSNWHWDCS